MREPAERGVGGARGDGRGELYTLFSRTLGVYITLAPLALDALKDQWQIKRNSSRQPGKQAVFSEKYIWSQVMHILHDMNHMGDEYF